MKYKSFLLLALVLLASCSITKRKYLPGYAIDWKHKAPSAQVQDKPKTISYKHAEAVMNKIISRLPIFRADTDTLGAKNLFKSVHHNKTPEMNGGTPLPPNSNCGVQQSQQPLPKNYNNPTPSNFNNPVRDGNPDLNWAAISRVYFGILIPTDRCDTVFYWGKESI